jgi:hypothetical protein
MQRAEITPMRNVKKPRTKSGKDRRAINALKYGLQANRNLLPWEREDEFRKLAHSLKEDMNPNGVIEAHLVDELATIIWRKHRIGPAEAAAYQEGMLKPSKSLIQASELAVPGQSVLYAAEKLANLGRIERVLEWDAEKEKEMMHHDLSRNVEAERLVLLARYEAHLDRKFQRILATLLSLPKARSEVQGSIVQT